MTDIDGLPAGGYPPGVTPHLRIPFGLDRTGRVAVVDQDTDAEVLQTVRVLLATRAGERAALPRWGLSDPAFFAAGDPLSVEEIVELVADEEPRASVQQVEQVIDELGDASVTVGITTEGQL